MKKVFCLMTLACAGIFMTAAIEKPKGGAWCVQLRGCPTGDAGCLTGGSISDCVITCTRGGTVYCEEPAL